MSTTKNLPQAKGERGPRESKLPTRERNRLIAQTKIKPLTVMLEVMAEHYERAKAAKTPKTRAKAQQDAVSVAAQVAPYLHPKLQATTLKGDANAPLSFTLSLPDSATLKAAIRGKG